ncbi:MAG TPA: hypothetical protein PLD46_07335, partial [Hyphomicrobium sp.]|nr:hypothetical protein [Hyphomicrobium sp.]
MNFARHTLELSDGRMASATAAAPSPPRAFAGTSLAVSLMFHSAVAMAAIAWRSTSDTGAVPLPSDAISIEMVATDVTDAREDTVERRAAAASLASAAAAVSEVQPDQTVDTVEAQTV